MVNPASHKDNSTLNPEWHEPWENQSRYVLNEKQIIHNVLENTHYTSVEVSLVMEGEPKSIGKTEGLSGAIPIYANTRDAIDAYQNGQFFRGTFNAAMANSDVIMVKATIAGMAKAWIAAGLLTVEQRSLQHMFGRHAADFGVTGNWNKAMAGQFEDILRSHMDGLVPIQGTYRGNIPALHYFNPTTGLNVMTDLSGNLLGMET